jgi:hypothetical protein
MQKYFTRPFLIFFAFLSAVALAAAGDRFINNPNSNADVVIQVNKAGSTTEAIRATGSTGAVSLGVSSNPQTHTVNGALAVSRSSATADFSLIRTTSSSGGAGLQTSGNGSLGTLSFTNGSSAAPFTNTVGGYDTGGAWTIGATSSTQTHIVNGKITLSESGLAYPALIRSGHIASIASGATSDVTGFTGQFQGIFSVACNNTGNGNVQSMKLFSLGFAGGGGGLGSSQLNTANGTGGACNFTVTVPTSGTIRITNSGTCTGASPMTCHWWALVGQTD